MTTIRRLYLYLVSFIALLLTVVGVIVLIGLIVDQGFDAFRGFMISSSAPTLAVIIVGGVAWGLAWRSIQREADASPDERAAGMRKLYLYGVMAISLLAALVILRFLLSDVLLRLFDTGWNGYKPWTPLLSAVVLGLVWRWHDWIALTDKAANADGARGGDVRRGYWFILAAFGVWGLLEGLGIFLGGFVSHLGGQAPLGGALGNLAPLASLRGQDWMQTLFPPLAQIVIAAVVVWLFWWPSQKAAAGGDADERSSKMRSLLIHLTVLIMSIVALSGLIQILQEVLSRLLQGGSRGLIVLSLYDPIAQVIVGALASWYFFARVRSTLPTPRLSEYIIAGVAFLLGLAAVINLVTALLLTLGGRGQRIEDILVNALPGLLVGGLIWFWRWRVIHRETLPPPQPVIAGSAEDTLPPTPIPSPAGSPRIDVWRKVYLYVYQLGGLLLVLVGSISILQYLIASILGQPSVGRAANFLADLSSPLAMLIVGGLLSFFMLRINVDDARASGMSTEEVMRQTLGDNLPSWAIALAAYILIGPVLLILVLATLGPAIGNIFSNIAGQLK